MSKSTRADRAEQADIRRAYEALAARLREALEERRELDLRIDELEQAVASLEGMLGIAPDDRLSNRSQARRGTRVAAVEQILAAADDPLSPADVHTALEAMGRTETRKDVASALSYLAAQGRAQRVGPGQWTSGEH